ncbi:MAG: leucine-rich repeat domain-containing protein, partial [Lachnospiraceae bacterium]|nr:leucine-rich repeat domain-containing protein [Lachnospiraceae bacterium]
KEYASDKRLKYVDATRKYALTEPEAWFYVSPQNYTGMEIKPYQQLVVSPNQPSYEIDGVNIPLYEGYDYSITYSNNISCGEATATITGLGCYTGIREESFTISRDLTVWYLSAGIAFKNLPKSYDEADARPQVFVAPDYFIDPDNPADEKCLTEGVDYVLRFDRQYYFDSSVGSDAVVVYVYAYGKGKYSGYKKSSYTLWKENGSGTCGAEGNEGNVTWSYDGNSTLTISGTGAVAEDAFLEYISPDLQKYSSFSAGNIKNIVVEEGITELKTRCFEGITLLRRIEFPSTLEKIDSWIFSSKLYKLRKGLAIYGKTDCAREFASAASYMRYVDATKTYDLTDSNAWFFSSPQKYTGMEVEPFSGFGIYYGDQPIYRLNNRNVPLYEGLDYNVTYSDNVECGTATAAITGVGFYTGNRRESFTIDRNITVWDIDEDDVEILLKNCPDNYEDAEIVPEVAVSYKGTELAEGTDYILRIDGEYGIDSKEGYGEVEVTVYAYGIGRYSGCQDISYWLRKDIEKTNISMEYDHILYDGTPKNPRVTITTSKGEALTENEDYTLRYENNIYPGEAIVTVTGTGTYIGSGTEVSFQIDGISIQNASIALDETIFTYDGSPKRPSAQVTLNGKALTADKDFSVSYNNNVNAGTAYITVTGEGIYAGSISASFQILPYSAGKDSVYSKENTFIDGDYVYAVTDDEQNEVEVSSTANKGLTKAVIPAEVSHGGITYKVTSIGEKAFYKNTKIKNVVIGNNVSSIENYAFYGCKNAVAIQLGQKVELIGDSSFRKCTKLKAVTLPKSMEELGKNAFYGCKKLKSITINAKNAVNIGNNALKGISKNAVIKVPSKQMNKYKKQLKSKTGFKKTMKIKKK